MATAYTTWQGMSGKSAQIGTMKIIIQSPVKMKYKTTQKGLKHGAIPWSLMIPNVSFEAGHFYVMIATAQATEYQQECPIHRIQE